MKRRGPVTSRACSWDAGLARLLVRPLVKRRTNPNHVTSLRLGIGLAGIAGFATGGYLWTNVGALLFVISNLLDHADGELARLTGQTSKFGHVYDLASDALVHTLLFAAIGLGLATDATDDYAVAMGLVAGVSVSVIFVLRMVIQERLGRAGIRQPRFGAFEAEDVLYLVPIITLTDTLRPFLTAAALGAPVFCLWVMSDWLRSGRAVGELPRT